MVYNIFLDANVFLDVFLQRTDEWKIAEQLLRLGADYKVKLYTSPNNLINVMYALKRQKLTQKQIIEFIELALTYTKLSETSGASFSQGLNAGFTDLEDAVQYYTALTIPGIDYFITSNYKDYKKAVNSLPVLTPKQFIALFNKK